MSKRYKLVVTVPEADGDKLRQATGDAGGGQVGKYSHCSFTVKGVGHFMPQAGANPAIGAVGTLEEVTEERIEINCTDDNLKAISEAILAVHPYEEPVIDVYALV